MIQAARHHYVTPYRGSESYENKPAVCPFCGTSTQVTGPGRLLWHLAMGFSCPAVGMTLAGAAAVELDAVGNVVGLDETLPIDEVIL